MGAPVGQMVAREVELGQREAQRQQLQQRQRRAPEVVGGDVERREGGSLHREGGERLHAALGLVGGAHATVRQAEGAQPRAVVLEHRRERTYAAQLVGLLQPARGRATELEAL